jgi:transposase
MPGPQHKYKINLDAMQESQLKHISNSYTLPYGEVVRAKVILLSHEHPEWENNRIAHQVGCSLPTVKEWRQRWVRGDTSLQDRPRSGAPRFFLPIQRVQIIALACSNPKDHGQVWQRWSGEKLAQIATQQRMVDGIGASTIRDWLRADKIKPWQHHPWEKPSDPLLIERGGPVLDLYEKAPQAAKEDEMTCSIDEKTSIQARNPIHETRPAIPEPPVHIAARYERKGALHLFCALIVATGAVLAQCFDRKRFCDFQAFLLNLFALAHNKGVKVLNLIMDNGSTHAPKQLAKWISSLNLPFKVNIFWLPKYASWLNQVEIIFSKVQRDVLTPNDFPNKMALQKSLLTYCEQLNLNPKPINWTYTKDKFLFKFTPHDLRKQLAA